MKSKNQKDRAVQLHELRKLAASNPQVDPAILEKTIELVSYIRVVGAKSKGFNLVRSSEARLKAVPPATHRL